MTVFPEHDLISGMTSKLLEHQGYFHNYFKDWGFTKTETEVGLLILVGMSLRDIADQRGTSETTTRQQALSLYKKASVEGRHQLSAFFLEKLMLDYRLETT